MNQYKAQQGHFYAHELSTFKWNAQYCEPETDTNRLKLVTWLTAFRNNQASS